MIRALVTSCLLTPLLADWGYTGSIGPERWTSLDPIWENNAGDRQSPIDLPSDAPASHVSLDLDHRRAPAAVTIGQQSLRIDVEGTQRLVFGGAEYTLDHIHFHTASEHSVDGALADGEAHLVHTDAYGRLLVLGVLLQLGSPSEAIGEVLGGATSIDPSGLLPLDRGSFWTYPGSLTTPPLTEGVTWVVLRHRLGVSGDQLARLEEICDGNRRPVQPTSGRRVESVGPT